jgi:hypothetical protein
LSDDIELTIRRDLDRLPVLPEERWMPKERSSPARFASLVARVGVFTVVLLVGATLGSALTYIGDQVFGASSASVRPRPATTSVPTPLLVSRQFVLAHVRGLSAIVPRAQRFEAKLVSSIDVPANLSAPRGRLFWVVAVAGDVNCSFCVLPPPQPLHSALFWFDAYNGLVLAAGQSPAMWPDGFEALPDRSLAFGSRTLIGKVLSLNADVIEFQEVGSAEHLRLRTDDNTAYTWTAGLAGGNVVTIDELPPQWDSLVSVTFDQLSQADGSHRLEALITGWNTK